MKPSTAPLACAMGVLVLLLVLAIVLIPALDAELRRHEARKAAANDNARVAAPQPERKVG